MNWGELIEVTLTPEEMSLASFLGFTLAEFRAWSPLRTAVCERCHGQATVSTDGDRDANLCAAEVAHALEGCNGSLDWFSPPAGSGE